MKWLTFMLALFGRRRRRVDALIIPKCIQEKASAYSDQEMHWNLGLFTYQAVIQKYSSLVVINYNFFGKLSKVVQEVELQEVPANVQRCVIHRYAGHFLQRVYEVNARTGRTYICEIRKGLTVLQLLFDPDGTLIQSRNRMVLS